MPKYYKFYRMTHTHLVIGLGVGVKYKIVTKFSVSKKCIAIQK